MKSLKGLAGQTLVYGLPSIVVRLLNYLLVPLYTYTYSTAEYGTVTSLYAYMSFLNILLTYGMETSLFNFSRLSEDKKVVYNTILTSVVSTSIIFFALAYLLRDSIAIWVREGQHPEYILYVAIILCTDAIASITFAKLREQNKARLFATIKSLNIFSTIIFNLFFIVLCPYIIKHHSWGYDGVNSIYNPATGVGYVFVSQVYANIITLALLSPVMLKYGAGFDAMLWKRIMPYTLPLMLAGFAGMINETLDRIILVYLLPATISLQQTGIYGACYKLSIIITLFIQAFRYAAEPYFFANASDRDFHTHYALIMKYFIAICLVIFLATTLNLAWLQYFIGKDFRQGLKVVPILLFANLCLGVYYNLSIWYKVAHKTIIGAWLTLFGAVLTILINVIFIPRYGYMASAWATLICYAATMTLSWWVSRKQFPVKFDLPKIGFYTGLSLTLYFLSISIHFSTTGLSLVFNNFLIILFIAILFFIEKPIMSLNPLKRNDEDKSD